MTRPLILAAMLAACTPMPDRMDCTDGAAWRSACDRDETAKEAAPETGGDTGTPDEDTGNPPEEPDTEPEAPEKPTDGQNPGNDKDVGNAPFDGERGEEPSGRE